MWWQRAAPMLPSMGGAKGILVAYDGSEAGRRALDAAADLVGYGSTLAVVGICTGSDEPLGDASRYLSGRHVFARYIDAQGRPAEAVLEKAAELSADIIVVANLNGSLEHVVSHAPCNVLVVR
jgi:nucleotide-binding universal stress UspA family protein